MRKTKIYLDTSVINFYKYQEPQTMKDLHEIREEHYEATKNMSFEELMKSIEAEALKIMKEYHLNFKIAEKH